MAAITELLCDGHIKQVYATDDPGKVVIRYKDVATAYRNIKRATLKGKSLYNNKISALIFEALKAGGVETHFIEVLSDSEQLCRRVEIIPLEVIVRNYAAGSMAHRLGLRSGEKMPHPVYEICFNSEALGDPLINEDHADALGLATYEELRQMREVALRVNEILSDMFVRAGIKLADFKVEFGRTPEGTVLLSDEISPDTCRLWDAATGEVLDKDRFRHDLGAVLQAYDEVYRRLKALNE